MQREPRVREGWAGHNAGFSRRMALAEWFFFWVVNRQGEKKMNSQQEEQAVCLLPKKQQPPPPCQIDQIRACLPSVLPSFEKEKSSVPAKSEGFFLYSRARLRRRRAKAAATSIHQPFCPPPREARRTKSQRVRTPTDRST